MGRTDYPLLPGFRNLHLEESRVRGIDGNHSLEIHLDLAVQKGHPLYSDPQPGEKFCFKQGSVQFPGLRQYEWLQREMPANGDPRNTHDYGAIDQFYELDGVYFIHGEWGELRVESESPVVRFEKA